MALEQSSCYVGNVSCGIANWLVACGDDTTQCATTATVPVCSRLHDRPQPPSSLSYQPNPHMQPSMREMALAVKLPHGQCKLSRCQLARCMRR